MEVVGVVSGIISIMGAIIKIQGYLREVKNVPKELEKLARAVDIHLQFLRQLEELVKRPSRPATIRELEKALQDGGLCEHQSMLAELGKKLQKLPDKQRHIGLFRRTRPAGDFAKELEGIRDFESAVKGILGVHGLDTALRIECNMAKRYREEGIFAWLSKPNFSYIHDIVKKKRHGDTGSWFLNSGEFNRWKTCTTSATTDFLCLYGIPGCGKTVLASTIVEVVSQHCNGSGGSNGDRGFAYHYFSFQGEQQKPVERMLESLVWQLGTQKPSAWDALSREFEKARTMSLLPSVAMLLEALSQIMQTFGETYIVLDALDECAKIDELLETLRNISGCTTGTGWPSASRVRILATSRKLPDVEVFLRRIPVADKNKIDLRGEPVNDDIKDYIHSMLLSENFFPQLQPNQDDTPGKKMEKERIRLLIEVKMMEKAGAMFRWAECQLISLRHCISLADIEEALASLPESLDATYLRILQNIPKLQENKVLTILRWLAFSSRPLTVQEVADGITIDVAGERVDPNRRVFEPHQILRVCPGFMDTIVVTENNKDDMGNITEREEIRLAHYSVKEYLMSDRVQTEFRLQEHASNTYLARACLIYLRNIEIVDHQPENIPLAAYAAQYWPAHVRVAEDDEREKDTPMAERPLTRQIDHLFGSRRDLAAWARSFDLDRQKPRPDATAEDSFPTPLYYASLCGIERYMRYRIDHCGAQNEINKDGGEYGSPLRAACRHGFAPVVRSLLVAGADVMVKPGELSQTTMHLAVLSGNMEVVRLVLQKQRERKTATSYLEEADSATSSGFLGIVKLLLDEPGTNINAAVGLTGRLLQRAASIGRDDIVRLLLLLGADIDTESGWYGTALRAAALEGHPDVVKTLLANGANPYLHGGSPGSPLIAAISYKRPAVIRMLIEHDGYDVNNNEGPSGNALQDAASEGDRETVHLLLEHNADVNAEGGTFHTALQAAAYAGHEDIVKILLDRGARVDTFVDDGIADVIHLIPQDKSTNATGKSVFLVMYNKAGTPLKEWGTPGNDVVDTIPRNLPEDELAQLIGGVPVAIRQQGLFGSALCAAVSRQHETIVEMLIQAGANVNAHGGALAQPLNIAKVSGNTNIERLLRNAGAVDGLDTRSVSHVVLPSNRPEACIAITAQRDGSNEDVHLRIIRWRLSG